MEAVSTFSSAFSAAVANKFAGLTTTINIERTLEASIVDQDENPTEKDPIRQIIPVIQHGDEIKGTIVLTAPPGQTRVVGGLSLSLYASKVNVAKDENPLSKLLGVPKAEPGTTSSPFGGHSPPPKTHFKSVYRQEESLVLLEPGRYEVTGDIVVPFTLPTASLPVLETLELEQTGAGMWHWLEARVAAVGVRGYVQRKRDALTSMREGSAKTRLELNWQKPDEDKEFMTPSKRVAAVQRLCLQLPPAASLPAQPNSPPWLSVGDFGGEAKLTLLDGQDAVLGESFRCQLDIRGTQPLSKVEVRVLTKLDKSDPHPSRSMVVWSKELADALAAAEAAKPDAPDVNATVATAPADVAPTATAPAASAVLEADGSLTLSSQVELDFGAADAPPGAPRLCCSSGACLRLDTAFGPVQAEVAHEVQLRLTAVENEKAGWNGLPLRLTRTALSGSEPGHLMTVLPRPPEPWNYPVLKLTLKICLVFLGIISLIITLSFMAPHKCKWVVGKLGVEETAEIVGLIESKNGTSASWSARSMLAGGTQTVRRFLGSVGRRM